MPPSSGSRDFGRFNELADEFARRFRRGERPSLQEFVDRLPEMADEIREMFPVLVEVEQAEDDARCDVAPRPPAATPAPRIRQIGDYRILRELGRGGMGVVYEADQVSLGRRVALKVLPGHVVSDRKALERFRREAKAAARLHHTNIVPVFEVGREGDLAFYAMQLIQGQGLDQVIDELRRLRASDRTSSGNGAAAPADPAAPATAGLTSVDAPAALRQRDVTRVARSLLLGGILDEGPGSSAGGADATIGPIGTEPPDFDVPLGHTDASAVTLGDHDHPNAGPALDVSTSAVLPGGTPVSGVASSGHLQPFFRSVAQIGRQAAQGLAHAHARGIVHRDIKPSNLMLDTDGVVWITDFGLAKADDDGLTATGDVLGTLRYMAPERFRGEGDARADICALGLTLYELLTLRPAYGASDRLKLIEQIKAQEPARPRAIDRRIPRDLETIVRKAIDKEPQRRYASAQAMAEDLRRFLADEPIQARQISLTERYWRWARHHPGIAVLGGVLTALLVLGTIGSLLAARQFAQLAESHRYAADAERSARQEASRQAKAETQARAEADKARALADKAGAAALAETYRAMLGEVKALRAGHQPGWRADTLENLARLATLPTPRRDLVELRNQAVLSLGEFDIIEVARVVGLGNRVWSLAFSPDSRTLVTASTNGDIHGWDVPRRQHSWQVTDPAGMNRADGWPQAGDAKIRVRFLPDGTLARATWDHRVEFLSASGQPSTRPPIAGRTAHVAGLDVDRQGHWLAVAASDGGIDLHDAATGAVRRHFQTNNDRPVFALSPDGRWLAHWGPNNAVQIAPADRDGPPITLGRHRDRISALVFSPDGTTLASASWDQTARLWDVARREERMTLRGHKETVSDLAFSPDGHWIATTSYDYTTRIWDARTGQTLAVLPGRWFTCATAFSPDSQYLAVTTTTNEVSLYQLQGRREGRLLAGHTRGAQCLTFNPRRPQVASGADDHSVILWDPESGRQLRRWTAHENYVGGLAYSADGTLLASGNGSTPFGVRLCDAETGSSRRLLYGHAKGVRALAFDPTGRLLATGDEGGALILWDVDTGRIVRRETVGPSPVWSIAFLEEGRRLATVAEWGPIVVYDLEGTEPPRRVAVLGGIRRFVVDRTRNDLIVAGSGGVLARVSLGDRTVGRHLDKAHDGTIVSLALAPGGRLLATGGSDRRIILRDAETFEPLVTFPPWTGAVKDLAFDATGRWLALAGADSDVGLWDLDLLHKELAPLGLAWDQPAPAVLSAAELAAASERPRQQVLIIRPGNIDPSELERARRLVQSGVAAFREGRFAAATEELREASRQWELLRQPRPRDPVLAREHALALGVLASSLRDAKRSAEALALAQAALAIYESLSSPTPIDLYNMACNCAKLSALNDQSSAEDHESLEARAMGYLKRAAARDPARIVATADGDRDLDPLRGRADFRDLMASAAFPADPFVSPSPLARSVTLPASATLALKKQGYALLAAGRTPEGLSALVSASASDPTDTILAIAVAVLQAWLGKDTERADTCRRALEYARYTTDPVTAERTAKICSLRPVDDQAQRDAALGLARKAVKLGTGHGYWPYFQMALGLAEYRAGNDVAAEEALRTAAASAGLRNPHVSGTSAFYRAMTLFRQGKQAEARRLAADAASRMKPLPADEKNPLAGGGNADDLILWMACKEARALLELDAASLPVPPAGK
jgi:WD40 repeat protein